MTSEGCSADVLNVLEAANAHALRMAMAVWNLIEFMAALR